MRFTSARVVAVLLIVAGSAGAYSALMGDEPTGKRSSPDVLLVTKKLVVGGNGKPSIALQAAETSVSISLLDSKQLPRVVIGYANPKEAGSLIVLYDDAGKMRAEVSIPNEGESVLTLFDESGRKRVAASTSKEAAGLSLWDTKEQIASDSASTEPRSRTPRYASPSDSQSPLGQLSPGSAFCSSNLRTPKRANPIIATGLGRTCEADGAIHRHGRANE